MGDDIANTELPPRRKSAMGKRGSMNSEAAVPAPCGACKFLRRKCVNGCIFAPHFGSDQGAARFAAVHKVFGASNVSKLLLHIPLHRRHDAVVTISYEAQARLSDPVYGCVSTVLALQHQVASLQAELAAVQTQLINSRLAFATTIQNSSPPPPPPPQQLRVLQPSYSNNSSASVTASVTTHNNPMSFSSNYEGLPIESIQLPDHQSIEEEDEEDSRLPNIFSDHLLRRR